MSAKTDPADHLTDNGWADDRLMQAYDLIWEVEQANKTIGLHNEFKALLASVDKISADIAETRAEIAAEEADQPEPTCPAHRQPVSRCPASCDRGEAL